MFNNAAFSGFSVNDLAAAKNFYTDVLGLLMTDMGGMGLQVDFTNGHRVFIYEKPDHQPATFTVLNFPVTNIDAAVADLEAKGITLEKYSNPQMPQDEHGILRGLSVNMGPDIAWFKDPAGNILAVLQES